MIKKVIQLQVIRANAVFGSLRSTGLMLPRIGMRVRYWLGPCLFFLILSLLTMNARAQTTAAFHYNTKYGALTSYQTVGGVEVALILNGYGRHPVSVDYDNGSTTFRYQDNSAGRRVVRKSLSGGNATESHLVFGGNLRARAEFQTDTSGTSVRSAIYGPGSVKARFGYDPLGKPTETDVCAETQTGDCTVYRQYPYRFQGHRYIAFGDQTQSGYQTGVTDNVDRLYSHDHGLRFMNTDLAAQSGFTIHGLC